MQTETPVAFNAMVAFQLFYALNLHFTKDSYDFFTHKGKCWATTDPSSWMIRKDAWVFERLARDYPTKAKFIGFIVSNLAVDEVVWSGNLLKPQAMVIYTQWLKRMESLHYTVKSDLTRLVNSLPADNLNKEFNSLFFAGTQTPRFLAELSHGTICFETAIALERTLGIYRGIDKTEDPRWPGLKFRLQKYSGFIKINDEQTKELLLDAIKSRKEQ